MNENDLTLISEFKITSAETDMEARLRPGSLVNLLVQSAINSADNLGFGFGGIRQQNLFWVLSRLTLEIIRPLKWHEKVEVETWPKDVEKILYLRDFIIRDETQNIVAKATSGWLAIDLDTKRAKKIDGLHAGLFVYLKNKHSIPELPEKINTVIEGDTFNYKAEYYDIDLNKHFSATRYIDRMMDTFPVEFHKNHYPKKLSVNFLKETMPGEILRFTRQRQSEETHLFEAVNVNTDAVSFRAKVEF